MAETVSADHPSLPDLTIRIPPDAYDYDGHSLSMLNRISVFADRVEVWNPGHLPKGLTPDQLSKPHSSEPLNPFIARPLYLAHYIESLGTGTLDVIRRCRESNLPGPDFEQRGNQFVVTL